MTMITLLDADPRLFTLPVTPAPELTPQAEPVPALDAHTSDEVCRKMSLKSMSNQSRQPRQDPLN